MDGWMERKIKILFCVYEVKPHTMTMLKSFVLVECLFLNENKKQKREKTNNNDYDCIAY